MILDNERLIELSEFEKKIGYEFKNKSLLSQAFVHKSYSNENNSYKNKNNERLEFLGDAVLELVFSKILYKKYKNSDEGFLTKKRSQLVCEKSFSKLSESLGIPDLLWLGKGEEKTGGRHKESIMADSLESFCGALYIDSGFEEVFNFIFIRFEELENNIVESQNNFLDYKTLFQEYIHKNKKGEFKYILNNYKGPAHDRTFYMDVYLNSKFIGTGEGKNKKDAEQKAAKSALINLGELDE